MEARGLVAGVLAQHLAWQVVAGTLHRLHGQADRADAARLQVGDDAGVAGPHRRGQRAAELGGEQPVRGRIVVHGVDRAAQRTADDLGAQRVAIGVGFAVAQQGGHVAVELAHLPLALVHDLHAQALGRDALVHLVVADQAQRLPRGGGQRAGRAARLGGLEHAVTQAGAEDQGEVGQLAAQVELRARHQLAGRDAGERGRLRRERLHQSFGGGRDGGLDAQACRIQCGLDVGGGVHRVGKEAGGPVPRQRARRRVTSSGHRGSRATARCPRRGAQAGRPVRPSSVG
ncbi:hypothetical protein X551_03788 [Methylibium sp. T29]|nr:hypothetical protein X551_03788 [Methylibium sp. T29]